MIIYKVTNKINGKIYIGQTVHKLSRRITFHKSNIKCRISTSCVFHNAVKKYGIDNFKWEVIHTCDNRNHLNEMEIYYIDLFKSYIRHPNSNGYNMTLGGDGQNGLFGSLNGMYGRKRSDRVKQIISQANKGRLVGDKNPSKRPEVRKILSEGKMGMKNPRASQWKLISPLGDIHIIQGGIKRNLKKYDLDYQTIWTKWKGYYKGWTLSKI